MKIVLTGAPSCGKTSVINYFKKKGQNTIEEVARKVLEEKKLHAKSLTDKEFLNLQKEIYSRMIVNEGYADHMTITLHFLDRSLIDIDGYYLYRFGKIPSTYQKIPKYNNKELERYHKVYVLDRLPLVNDGLRLEKNEEEAEKIHECLIKAYELKGYNPVRVPVIPDKNINRAIRKRAEFIKNDLLGLDTINEEYEKIQEEYNTVRSKYNLPKSLDLRLKGYNPIQKQITKHLMSQDYSW
jgi:predicted ATPase